MGRQLDQFDGTTILSVRRAGGVVLGGDGQVTVGNTVLKANARKVRRLHDDKVLAGFAGGTADAFTLFERFEGALDKYSGNLVRAAVELAKEWSGPGGAIIVTGSFYVAGEARTGLPAR